MRRVALTLALVVGALTLAGVAVFVALVVPTAAWNRAEGRCLGVATEVGAPGWEMERDGLDAVCSYRDETDLVVRRERVALLW